MEKHTNPEYNQDDFLNELIINEISETEIKGDVAIIGEWAFELDRSVPKIGRALGKADKLIFPIVEIISGPTLIDNGKKATFKAKATEITKGITRIELWLDGKKIEKETKTYEAPQTEITLDFEVNKNGVYTVKAYADLMASETVTVEGIIPAVEFTPNGSTEWKKQHTTKVTVEETAETITGMKYVWVKDDNANEPAISAFTQNCPSDGVITGGDDTMTGTYYLWVLLTIGTGSNQKTNICVSQGFNFDNEGPTVELTPTPVSETSFTLTATASDRHSGIEKYEFYIDNQIVSSQNEQIYTWEGPTAVENKECYVIVYDKLGNANKNNTKARTKLYTWKVWNAVANGTTTLYTIGEELKTWTTSYSNSNGWITKTYMTSIEAEWINDKSFTVLSSKNEPYNSENCPGIITRYWEERASNGYKTSKTKTWGLAIRKVRDVDSNYAEYEGYEVTESTITKWGKGTNLLRTEYSADINKYPKNAVKRIEGQTPSEYFEYVGLT